MTVTCTRTRHDPCPLPATGPATRRDAYAQYFVNFLMSTYLSDYTTFYNTNAISHALFSPHAIYRVFSLRPWLIVSLSQTEELNMCGGY